MPEGPQQYHIEELENAAAFAVHEIEKVVEALQSHSSLNIAIHSPEAAWGDPVQVLDALGSGALYARINFPEGLTAVLVPLDDAAFLTAFLLDLPVEDIPEKVRRGIDAAEAELLLGILTEVFAPRGAAVEGVDLYPEQKVLAQVVENDFGISFLSVKAELSPEGFADCRMMRLYAPQFAARFGARPGTSALDTQAVPALPPKAETPGAEVEKVASPSAVRAQRPREMLMRIPVRVKVRMAAKSVAVRDLLHMLPGSVIEFERKADGEVELLVNSHVVARGEAVRSGRRYGMRVTAVAPIEKRVGSLRR